MHSAFSATRSLRRIPTSCVACRLTALRPSSRTLRRASTKVRAACIVYVKKQHVGVVPGLDKFAAEYVSPKAIGEDGYLAKKGLVTLPKAEAEPFVSP